MIVIDGGMAGIGRAGRVFQKTPDIVVRAGLIALQRDHVITVLFDDLGSRRALAIHRVRRDNAAFQRHRQQFGHRGDLVGLLIGGDLAQRQPLADGPCMHHV
jgi:hypothetical protein